MEEGLLIVRRPTVKGVLMVSNTFIQLSHVYLFWLQDSPEGTANSKADPVN